MQSSAVVSVLTILGLIGGFTYAFWEKLLKRWTVPAAYGMFCAGLLIMGIKNPTMGTVYLSGGLIGLGNALSNPYIVAQIMDVCPKERISLAQSLFMVCQNLARFFGLYIPAFLSRFSMRFLLSFSGKIRYNQEGFICTMYLYEELFRIRI